MPDKPDTTIPRRPLPQRPRLGWQAWEATLGYMSLHHSPDALLKLQIYPLGGHSGWAASLSWAGFSEHVRDRESFGEALDDLWREVNNNHVIFLTSEAAVRQPASYHSDEWLDPRTQEALDRLIRVTRAVFENDWLLLLIYQPVEHPEARVQLRLLARDNTVRVGGRGPSLREACAELYRNAARYYSAALNRGDEPEPE